MIRVLHVIPSLERGGAERMLSQLVSFERPDRPEQRIVTLLGTGPFTAPVESAGIRVDALGVNGFRQIPGVIGKLRRIVQEWRPDVVQSWLYYADLAALAAIGTIGRRRPRLYWGVRCSELELDRYNRRLRLTISLCRLLSRLPDAIVVNSEAGARSHRQLGYPREKLVTIANGTDTVRFSPDPEAGSRLRAELGIAPDRQMVAHIARVDPQKDHGNLIEIAARLPAITFLAAGRGTTKLTGPDNLLCIGERDDTPALFNAADVFLSTSAYGEGFPNAVAEAMACGRPVVATDCGDAALIVGDAGIIVPRRDPAAGVRAIEEILALPKSSSDALGMSGRSRIETNFSLETAVRRFDQLHRNGRL